MNFPNRRQAPSSPQPAFWAIVVDAACGGPQDVLVCSQIARALGKCRLQPKVIVPAAGPVAESYRASGFLPEVVPHGPARGRPWWQRLLWSARCCLTAGRRFRRLYRASRPAVVFVVGSSGWPAVRSATKLGLPCFWYLRELSHEWFLRENELFPQLWEGDIVLRGRDRCGAHFLASSRTVVFDRLSRQWLTKATILREPVDPRFLRPVDEHKEHIRQRLGLPTKAPTVGVIPSMSTDGDWPFLLKCVKIVYRFLPSTIFVTFPGRWPFRRRLFGDSSVVKSLATAIRFLPPEVDPLDFYRACDVVAIIQEDSPSGLPALEAMATGRPVVARRLGAVAEVIRPGHNGVLVRADEFRKFAERILLLLTETATANRLATSGREYVLKYHSVYRFRRRAGHLIRKTLTARSQQAHTK